MFDDVFTGFLRLNFPEEYVMRIMSAREALMNYEYSLVEANIYKTMPDECEVDLHTSKMLFEQCLRDGFKQVFNVLGVRVNIRNISILDMLLRGLKLLEESTDHEAILNIIQNEFYSLDEITERLLSLVILDKNNLHEALMYVELADSNMFINRLYEYHKDNYLSSTDESTSERPNKAYLERIKRFITQYPDSLVAVKYANNEILFGKNMVHYVAENKAILETYNPNFPDKVPLDFIGLALFGNVGRFELSNEVKKAITSFYNDLKFTTKTNYLVDQKIAEIEGNGVSQ